MSFLNYDGLKFHYLERGTGLPVIFQHGLGGDTERVFAQVELPNGYRQIGLDCRNHGRTKPAAKETSLRFSTFADDLAVLLDHLGIQRAIIGGTSMGAGVALNFALRYPQRLLGLILSRPAWLDRPNETNVKIFAEIARLLREHGPSAGLKCFKQTALYAGLAKESSDSAESSLGLFLDPRALETVARFECIPLDAPNHDRNEWRHISQPVVILANRQDPIHPFEYAQALLRGIPGAQMKELTPKSVDLAQYLADLHAALAQFLQEYFPSGSQSLC